MRVNLRDLLRSAAAALCAFALSATLTRQAEAQQAQVDIDTPPGSPDGRGTLGPVIGASGTSGFDVSGVNAQQGIFGGRPGPTATRAPINQLSPPSASPAMATARFQPPALESTSVPTYGQLEIPENPSVMGPEQGLTLDQAIDLLLERNLNLMALRFEVPMAQADVLTASLRNNPIFYADSQLVPYGRFTNTRPGGQTQYDINITYPLDVWRKRRARILVYERAKKVTETQLQDAIRLQIDNLYTAYVDVIAATQNLEYSRAYTVGIGKLVETVRSLNRKGQKTLADVETIRAQLELAELQVRESEETLKKSKRTLALYLDLPSKDAYEIKVRSIFRDIRELPVATDELVKTALVSRPDLTAFRLGILRAQGDEMLARANKYSDVYLLWQPYTLQDNGYLGFKNSFSYAFGVTVSLPVYNRNQGNIKRAGLNVHQTEIEMTQQERQVEYDVEEAVREFNTSRVSLIEFEREIVPASRIVRTTALQLYGIGQTSIVDYLDAQKDYNEVVRKFYDAVVRHRRAMLDLNTAVGTRVLP